MTNHPSATRAQRRRAGSRFRPFVSLAVLAVLAASCGTNLDDGELLAANGSLTETAAEDGATAAGGGSSSVTGPSSGSGGSAGGAGTTSGGRTSGGGAGDGTAGNTAGGGESGEGTQGGETKSELLLGSFGTGTGPIGAQVAAAPVAVRAWVADVNERGGLNGHPVRVIFGDDGGDPGKALAIVRKMVEQDGVVALFGGFGAATSHTVAPYLDENGIPMIGGVPAPSTDTAHMIFNPQTGGTKGTYRSYLMTLRKQTEVQKIAFFYCREADTCTQAADAIERYAPEVGLELVYRANVSIAQPDYTAEVLAARNAGAEALVISLDIASVKRVISAADRQGWSPVVSGASQVYLSDVADGAVDVEGLLGAATVLPYTIFPKMRPYIDAVEQHVPGGVLGEYGASVWVAGKLMERIASGFDEPVTREQILDGLYSLREDTLGGLVPPITFNRGPHVDVNLCSYPIAFQDGEWVAPLGEEYVCAPD